MENKSPQFASDTSRRSAMQWAQGLLVLLIGLIIAHLGVTMFLVSELGTDTFTIFIQGLSNVTGFTIGTCHVAVCILLMIVMLVTTKGYVKPGTVLCAFCGGWIIDFFLWIFGGRIGGGSPMWIRIIVMVLGCVILSFGMSVVIKSNSGTGPNDLVAVILTDKINQYRSVEFRWVRIACDGFFVVAGTLLGGRLGAGTVAAVLLTGPAVQFFLPKSGYLIQKCFPDLQEPMEAKGESHESNSFN